VPEGEKNGGLSGGLSGGLKIELNETQQKVFLEITKRLGVMIKDFLADYKCLLTHLIRLFRLCVKKNLLNAVVLKRLAAIG
jgi:hypothetical protein